MDDALAQARTHYEHCGSMIECYTCYEHMGMLLAHAEQQVQQLAAVEQEVARLRRVGLAMADEYATVERDLQAEIARQKEVHLASEKELADRFTAVEQQRAALEHERDLWRAEALAWRQDAIDTGRADMKAHGVILADDFEG